MTKRVIQYLLSCFLLCASLIGYSQQQTLKGVIVDEKNEPVAGASVTEKGTANGTTSDATGNFLLNARSNSVLVVSVVGYQTQEIRAGNETTLTIALSSATTELGGVVITALGISKQKRELGFSVTEIKGTDIARTNEINPINACLLYTSDAADE